VGQIMSRRTWGKCARGSGSGAEAWDETLVNIFPPIHLIFPRERKGRDCGRTRVDQVMSRRVLWECARVTGRRAKFEGGSARFPSRCAEFEGECARVAGGDAKFGG